MTTHRNAIVWDGGLACLCASRMAEAAADGSGAGSFVVALMAPTGVSVSAAGTDKGDGPPSSAGSAAAANAIERLIGSQRDAELLHDAVPASAWAAGIFERSETAGPLKGLTLAQLMLASAAAAHDRGCSRVVWPVVSGGDLGRLHTVTECAAAVNTLAAVAASQPSDDDGPVVLVETPFADLTRADLERLADDLGVVRALAADPSGGAGAAG